MTKIEEMLQELCPNGVEWKELGEVAEIGTGKNNTNEQAGDGKYPFYVRSKDIKRINSYLFDEEAIIIPGEGGIGEIFHYVNGKYGLHQRAYRIHILDGQVNTQFVYYFLQTSFKQFILKKAVSATVSSIRKPMIEKFPIPIPPLEIQKEIVKILDKFTEYVTELTAELTAELTLRQQQYSFYQDKLLSFEDEVYQVEWKSLGELFDFKNGLNKGKKFFGKGTPIVNYTDVYRNIKLTSKSLKGTVDVSREEQERYSVKRGDVFFTRTSETQEEIGKTSVLLEDIENGVFSGFVLRARPKTDLLLPEYCAHCFNSSDFRKAIVRYSTYTTRALTNGGTLSRLSIPVPPLDIQSRIVQVLDNFDTVCNDLSIGLPKEIELRQKQYEYFRDKLLTFAAEGVYTDSTVQYRQDLIRLLQWVFGTIRVRLGAIADISRGKRVVRKELSLDNGYPVYQNSLMILGYYEQFNTPANTTFIVSAGAAGEIGFSHEKFWKADDVWTMSSESINQRFLYHTLLNNQSRIKDQVRRASIPRLSKNVIENLIICLPEIEVQSRIVFILDKFDTLTKSISQGLPKEIELRQKLYEYFREQLLRFD